MSRRIQIQPDNIQLFADEDAGTGDCSFYLLTNPEVAHCFELRCSKNYRECKVVPLEANCTIAATLNNISGAAHILVISPIRHIDIDDSEIQPKQKIIVMSCWETYADLDAIDASIKNLELSNPTQQQEFADQIFELGQATSKLIFCDPDYGSYAELNHLSDDYTWHELAGVLPYQSQFRDCGGKIALTPTHFNLFGRIEDQTCLDINGSLILHGYPVLQNTRRVPCIQTDQQRIYNKLATLSKGVIKLEVENGIVISVTKLNNDAKPAEDMLNLLFEFDSRHRIIYEIGFRFNKNTQLYAGNIGFNESFGGRHGIVHFGFGSRLTTQYHLDILCPNTRVLNDQNQLLFGSPISIHETA